MTDLKELHSQIQELSQYDRDTLLSEMEEQRASRSRKRTRSDFSTEELAVYAAVQEILLSTPPLHKFVESYGSVNFAEKVSHICAYTADARKNLNRKQTERLLILILTCLDKTLRSWNIPVTATSLFNNIDKLSFAVDQSFPGYAEAGFLHRVI